MTGSTSPVGRIICSTTTPPDCFSSYGPGVAETNSSWLTRALPLLEVQRPVVERRRQPEAVGDQHFLARAIAVIHAADLRHRLVALVDDDQRVGRQVVEQRRRRLARRAAGQVPRVVLDAVAVADLLDHLEVEHRPLVQPLRLEDLALAIRACVRYHSSSSLMRLDGALRLLARRDEVRLRIDRDLVVPAERLAGQRIERASARRLRRRTARCAAPCSSYDG